MRRRQQSRVHLGLTLVDVETRGEEAPFLERDRQRLLVDDEPARGVHQHRGGFIEREPARVDQQPRLVGERHVQADDVGPREQRVEIGRPAR